MNFEISETIKTRELGLSIQIFGLPEQRKFVLSECHAHILKFCQSVNWCLFPLSITIYMPKIVLIRPFIKKLYNT